MKPIILRDLPGLPKPMKLIRSQRCENCKWGEAEGPQSKNLFCHMNPPMVSILATNAGPMPFAAFPIVQPDQWCGKHQPKIGAGVVDAVPETGAKQKGEDERS